MTPPRSSRTDDRTGNGAGTGSVDSTAGTGSIDSVAVVIPARNEEQLIARCLRSVEQAIALTRSRLGDAGPNIVTVVAVDSSGDDTEAIARSFPGVSVFTVDAKSVGAARREGVDLALDALDLFAHGDASRVWIANTDADSAVPATWLLHQLDLAAEGADVVIGTVRPDFADLSARQVEAWLRQHPPGVANGHIHGANLGFRADLYIRAGGFAPLSEHEDVDLVARLAALDARTVPTASAEVLTSGRQAGRTPGGYAGYLRTELVPPA
ncbi:hypothetical protein B7R54_08040 [Subtercola boreus]|uniref:4,4'-diaponeurosporenoate glycosyltransferase n=1 Tax=Subtercola boreus TaxID=120213 RepID=A0A3E0VIF8_9MICO|nr:glycosyltransferase [Subtercola boreus]RFA09180.1 hypothetical protein B7R54_08040 [Subtercola boreus]TQL53801.1 glycosyl transferase family 2 [Subtercola boreus]